MRRNWPVAAWFVSAALAAAAFGQSSAVRGSEACASCHSEIYKSYSKTVMATASGMAFDGLITGEFEHKPSGVRYSVYQKDGRAWMSYERGDDLRGQRELLYFIGSGVKGRSYLFSQQGFLFETPDVKTRTQLDRLIAELSGERDLD